jgi:hypothetical protein
MSLYFLSNRSNFRVLLGAALLASASHLSAAVCTADIITNRSLVVTDAAVLSKFPFSKMIDTIVASAKPLNAAETRVKFYQQWMNTFNVSSTANPLGCDSATVDPNGYGIECPRGEEAKLATINPFRGTSTVKFTPTGIFNRFDLAPASGANCGEYRVTYAMTSTDSAIGGRALMIFEGVMPNPTPTLKLAGCKPVADFWRNLSLDTDVNSRATKIQNFYFNGTAIPGFPAVVAAKNYGLSDNGSAFGSGQIRTNFFVNFNEWHLREFKPQRVCNSADANDCTLNMAMRPVKQNPANELFAGTHAKSAAFEASFLKSVSALASGDRSTIGMSIPNQFSEFESVSQRSDVVYKNIADAGIKAAITSELTTLGSSLTAVNILDRATTQTCAGCHRLSAFTNLGNGLVWPADAGFVHITETGTLSSALTTVFLPHRQQVLGTTLNDASCTSSARSTSPTSTDDLTVGGSLVGAAN